MPKIPILPFRAASALVLVACAGLASAGCSQRVYRIDPDQVVDLSGRWNDTDSRLVADTLIRQSFAGPTGEWARRHIGSQGGRRPVVIVGTIRNRSLEHVPVGSFARELERAYLQSGLVQVVASSEEREEIRAERADQQENAAAPTRARLRAETGADYVLQGEVQSIEDRERGDRVVYYQVDMNLVDLQSNAKVWVGQHRIKKLVNRPRFTL